jgi:hypothetical protein
MNVIDFSFITGVMVGFEVSFDEPDRPYIYSLVIDLFIVRIVMQKLKNV